MCRLTICPHARRGINAITAIRTIPVYFWPITIPELIAASKGLGYLLSDGRETSRADIVLAAILLLAVLGKTSDSLMLLLEQRLLAWRDSFESPDHA